MSLIETIDTSPQEVRERLVQRLLDLPVTPDERVILAAFINRLNTENLIDTTNPEEYDVY